MYIFTETVLLRLYTCLKEQMIKETQSETGKLNSIHSSVKTGRMIQDRRCHGPPPPRLTHTQTHLWVSLPADMATWRRLSKHFLHSLRVRVEGVFLGRTHGLIKSNLGDVLTLSALSLDPHRGGLQKTPLCTLRTLSMTEMKTPPFSLCDYWHSLKII